MHDELWSGVNLKLEYAGYHFNKMWRAAMPAELDGHYAAMAAMGQSLYSSGYRDVYPEFDAFLVAVRSAPDIIQSCFGADPGRAMKPWLAGLPAPELARRQEFTRQFQGPFDAFRCLPFSKARIDSQHRKGYVDVELRVSGRFGLTYIGSPVEPVPVSEVPAMVNPQMPVMGRTAQLQPSMREFTYQGRALFDVCREYLQAAQTLVNDARGIAASVHGSALLTPPPDA